MLTVQTWIHVLSTSSPQRRTGQSICSVLLNALSKRWETPGIYRPKHPPCKQLRSGSFKGSPSSPPCRAPPDTACRAIQTANSLHTSPQQPPPRAPRDEGLAWQALKAALWKPLGGFLVGYQSHFWKISQSSQLHQQSQRQTGHYFKLERIFWCCHTWKKNGSYLAQHGLLKHLMRGNPYHEKAVKHHRRKFRFFLEAALVRFLLMTAQRLKTGSFQHWWYKRLLL